MAPALGQAASETPGTIGIFGHKGPAKSIFAPTGPKPQDPNKGTIGIFGHTNGPGITGIFRGIENTIAPGPPDAPRVSPEYRPPPPSVGLVLTGVVIGGDRPLGFVQDAKLTGNKVVTVRLGDAVGPYKVTAIEADRINFDGPGGPFTVRLARQTGTPSGSASSVSAAPPSPSPTQRGAAGRRGGGQEDGGSTEVPGGTDADQPQRER